MIYKKPAILKWPASDCVFENGYSSFIAAT